MPDSKRRDRLESQLKTHLRAAEEQFLADPRMKDMLGKVRQLYLQDKVDFLQAVNPAPSNSQKQQRNLPLSRIPELILVLDQLGKKSANLFPAQSQSASDPPLKTSQIKIQASQETTQNQINQIAKEIQKNEQLYVIIKSEEPAILARKGRYSAPSERLKFERLLRELPGRISSLKTLKAQLEEEQQ